jgi:hypothetical protein
MVTMTTNEFKKLCKDVLIPKFEMALRRQMASLQLSADFMEVVARQFSGLSDALDAELFRIHEKLDKIIALAEDDKC